MNSSNIPSAESVPEDKIASPHHRKMLEQIIDAVYGNGDKLVFIDLFCGAGGMSEGLAQSLEEIADVLGCRVDEFATLHAVNHDSAAIKAHSSNHAWATHYEVPIQQIEPEDVVGRDTTVSLMLAAPDCTHHSNARGGGPKDPDARMQPREVLTWAERIDVRNLLIENVPALRGWGPLNSNNRIIPDKKGEFFDHWLKGLSIEGFNVEHRVLCCADYGDATTRKRLFIACRKDDGVSWPEKSHSEDGSGDTEEWRPAANIIDWDDPGESLWVRDLHDGRRNPLAHSTMQRIAAGMRRHAGDALEPFVEVLEHIGRKQDKGEEDEDEPNVKYTLPELREQVVPAEYAPYIANVTDKPFFVSYGHLPVQGTQSGPTSVTLRQHNGDGAYPLDTTTDPVPTVAKAGAISMANIYPFVLPKNGRCRGLDSNPAYHPANEPLHTIISSDTRQGYTVNPSLIRYSHGGANLDIEEPLPTITTAKGGVFSLAFPKTTLIPFYSERSSQAPRTHSIGQPHPTIPASKTPTGIATPFLIEYYNHRNARPHSLSDPLPTQPQRDRFALVIPELFPLGLNIRFRMLKPDELAAAHSFPSGYQFASTKTKKVEQIGNSVPVRTAKALSREMLIGQKTTLSDFIPEQTSPSAQPSHAES